ncbi:hypothetical protein MIND_01338500 [Mycena indigotica]|uniref:DUF6534 domain-containing protein n=1 Tax=Mycena indigotica TaxID=2126181 RepID=A0A8H6S0B7_9AGAR|nr:uncharacterized protein MIND_01338500 [Mycena indigotica]KAF7290248.1 hypothetical protein MIND_01338500 [Mycena indigotica]
MSSPAPQALVAPALIGTWANFMVYMLELVLAWRYYTSGLLRPTGANTGVSRLLVPLQLLVDALGTIFSSTTAYLMLVVHWGDYAYLARNSWALSAFCITGGMSGYLEQVYLIRRYGALSTNYLVCAVLALTATTSLAAAIGVGIITFKHPSINDRGIVAPVTLLWFISSAFTDVAIASSLVIQLCRYKSPFKETQNVVRQLIVTAIQTGSVTALLATLAMIGFVVWPETAITFAFGFPLGRVYGCTLLYNLVFIRGSRNGSDVADSDERLSGSRSRQVSGGRDVRERATALSNFGGIHIHQIVQVTKDTQMDDGDDISIGNDKRPTGV